MGTSNIENEKKLIYFITLVLILILLYTNCLYTKGYDDTLKFFIKNEQDLNNLSKIFYNQSKVKYICRNKQIFSFNDKKSFFILTSKNQSLDIEFDERYENEEDFRKFGFDNLVDHYSKEEHKFNFKRVRNS